jgi:hypothetical protein
MRFFYRPGMDMFGYGLGQFIDDFLSGDLGAFVRLAGGLFLVFIQMLGGLLIGLGRRSQCSGCLTKASCPEFCFAR